MLNRHTWINDPDAPSIDIRGYATWRCPSGHVSEVWLRFNGNYAYGGYAWDFCEHCSHHPNVLQDTKAHLMIFSQWRDERLITLDQYRQLTYAVVNTTFSPAIKSNPITFLGLPTRQQVQNQTIRIPD